jgi:hypothetical protein
MVNELFQEETHGSSLDLIHAKKNKLQHLNCFEEANLEGG